ncbi:MAG: N-6 DNA methylase, partial [Daejeonella sp.]
FQYTQGFSPQIVDYYLDRWNCKRNEVFLDPFVGSGTSLLQCQARGIKSYGWDISPLSIFLSKVKTTTVDLKKVNRMLEQLYNRFKESKKHTLTIPSELKEHFEKVFSQAILEQLSEFQNWFIEQKESAELNFILCAALSTLEEVSNIRKHGSHYRFMNNDNVGVNKKLSFEGLSFIRSFKTKIKNQIAEHSAIKESPTATVYNADARNSKLKRNVKADWVITSPPYLNRNNYIAQSKTEMFFGGLLKSFNEYRDLTKRTLRSHVEAESINTETYHDNSIDEIVNLVSHMGESYKGVSEMIHGYFEDMNSVLNNLVNSTKVNCKIAFVVGCSRWSGVVVPTDLLIAKIAEQTGKYELEQIEVVRYKGNAPQQMARFGRYPVRESVVILKRI